ncbi:hypothetical protein NBO_10g0058 [Nosema bombycis CQ1]|uniref:Rho-GAP domain-containing protein n=1 Tax=Nosema bombycis (strain CQ1 / CVCC 102059) TaxID=578461 RepID=R0MQA8_NOSB1|nr:hypothetical protein NBO_10g0058 [Nosema bombycis CQ1]|eukprot:EOB15068.1 hypothetical protein NBO_10g0058 [Nosema bombycis CQ1]
MVLIELFKLFKVIDLNVESTKMSIESLLNLFSIVLFPKEVFTDLNNVLYMKTIMDRIFLLDFKVVPSLIIPKDREIKKNKKV